MTSKNRGSTIMELLIAGFVMGLLSLLTVALFKMGTSGWKKLEAQSTMLADYEVLNTKVERDAQRSIFNSASTASGPNGTTLAFLSAVNSDGVFTLDPTSFQPVWQKYVIFYFDNTTRKVYLAELPLDPGSPESDNPEPLEDYDAGTGNIEDYRTGGRLIMTDVDKCEFTLDDSMLTLEINGSRARYGSDRDETLHMIKKIAFRN